MIWGKFVEVLFLSPFSSPVLPFLSFLFSIPFLSLATTFFPFTPCFSLFSPLSFPPLPRYPPRSDYIQRVDFSSLRHDFYFFLNLCAKPYCASFCMPVVVSEKKHNWEQKFKEFILFKKVWKYSRNEKVKKSYKNSSNSTVTWNSYQNFYENTQRYHHYGWFLPFCPQDVDYNVL